MVFYNPFARFDVTQGWNEGSHRYPYNAVDYRTPIGTRFGAPAAGVYVRMPSNLSRTDPTAAGHYGYLLLPNGDRIYFCHLSQHIAGNGAKVKQGDVLAATGNTGFVRPNPDLTGDPTAGAHMHTYGRRASGTRFDWTVGASSSLPKPAGRVSYKHTKVVLAPLNLRKSPKTGDIITVIPPGTVIKTGRTAAGWTPVKVGKTTGWVAAEFAVLRTKTVTKNGLLLRDRPTTLAKGAKVRARLKKGQKVTVLGVHGKTSKAVYWKVRAGVRTGWVHSGNIK